ncbi:hypothetical protein PIB30_058898 [Stylosanthes scabra]|uniref:CCHC-type domain-containing protein n=1 Tax=Stylosanthes scabra TaxID=79078 RepID=A0ABU6QLV7_9FABA|nr:hypothetical protein [Stylosanthes scabra]
MVYTKTSQETKRKGVALKSKVVQSDDESEDCFSDDELVFFARKLRRMMRNKARGKGSSFNKDYKKDLSKIICHSCREPGHYKFECPKFKKDDKMKKDKKKVMMATWKDLENDSDYDDEASYMANVFFMADLDKLYEERNLLLFLLIIAKNERLQERIKSLNRDLEQFARSSSNLDKLLGYQRPISEKYDLGYSGGSGADLKTIFVKAKASTSNTKSSSPSPNVKNSAKEKYCNKGNKVGHTPPQCFVLFWKE